MIQSLRNANAFPPQDPFPYRSPGAAASAISAVSTGSVRGVGAGGNVAAAKVQKLEARLQQAEQSNRALLEELMRVQNDMKISVRTNQQRLEEERQSRQQMEGSVRALLARLAEVERRAQKAEQTSVENKTALTQLASHSRSVEQALNASHQGQAAIKDAGLLTLQQQMDGSRAAREQLEKAVTTLRGELKDLRGKVADSSKVNADARLQDLNTALQDIKNQMAIEQKAREALGKQLNGRSLNDVDNNITKMNDVVHQRIAKLETMGVKSGEENVEQLSKTVKELEDLIKSTVAEMEKVMTAEIQARRDQGTLLKSKIHECNDNFRAGMLSLQGKPLPKGSTSETVNWKLDAVKVHEISQENADEVRKDLEKQVNELKQQLKTIDENLHKQTKETDLTLKQLLENRNQKTIVPTISPNSNHPTESTTKSLTSRNNINESPTIIGNNLDQRLDLVLFTQEKTKQQVNGLQHDVDGLMKLNQTGGLEDRFTALDRRVTARMDGETRNRNTDVKLLKDDIELLKKRETTAVATPAQPTAATLQREKVMTDDVKNLKEDMKVSQTSFRKLAESVQVVKTTLNERLDDEVRIRKTETGRLQQDMDKVVSRLQQMED